MRPVEKIYFEKPSGEKIIIILQKPISFPIYYAMKYAYLKEKKYKVIKPIWKD
jgi:hypothetical protein